MKRARGNVRRLRSGRWAAEITVGVKADGRSNRRYATFGSRAEAEEWVDATYVSAGKALHGVSLWTAWTCFEADRKESLSRKTMYNYGHMMKRWWKEPLGSVPVDEITPAMVQAELSKMTHENALHAKTALSSVLTYCVSPLGLLERNPVRGHKFAIPAVAEDGDAWDDDPFAAIERANGVWDSVTALDCMGMIRGLELEPVWLSCIGAGLRVEEAFALRGMDVRRVEVDLGDDEVAQLTQCAVHHARTDMDDRKSTKTRGSVRIANYLEPFGRRMWELACEAEGGELVCKTSPASQNRTWRLYFEEPPEEMHARMSDDRVRVGALHGLPYVPLSKMRASHETLLQDAGVVDARNADMHGHSLRVARAHYMKADGARETVRASKKLRLVG